MPGINGEVEFDMDAAVEDIAGGLGLTVENTEGIQELPDGQSLGEGESSEKAAGTEKPAGATGTGSQSDTGADTGKPAESEAAKEAGEATGAGEQGQQQSLAAPKTWRPEAAAKWATIDPTVQQEILKREEDIFKGLERYRGAADFGQKFQQSISEFAPVLQQYNIDPFAMTRALYGAHFALSTGNPESKKAAFLKLAQDYGVDLTEVDLAQTTSYVDPQVRSLQQELSAVKSTLSSQSEARAREDREKFIQQVNAFAGSGEAPYFQEVVTDIAMLMKADRNLGLKEAYQKAVWANPQTRQKEIERFQAEAEAKRRADAEKIAAQKRVASAANVKKTTNPGRPAAPVGTMDDTLQETLAAINARSQ